MSSGSQSIPGLGFITRKTSLARVFVKVVFKPADAVTETNKRMEEIMRYCTVYTAPLRHGAGWSAALVFLIWHIQVFFIYQGSQGIIYHDFEVTLSIKSTCHKSDKLK